MTSCTHTPHIPCLKKAAPSLQMKFRNCRIGTKHALYVPTWTTPHLAVVKHVLPEQAKFNQWSRLHCPSSYLYLYQSSSAENCISGDFISNSGLLMKTSSSPKHRSGSLEALLRMPLVNDDLSEFPDLTFTLLSTDIILCGFFFPFPCLFLWKLKPWYSAMFFSTTACWQLC